MKRPTITLIAALDRRRAIGRDGDLPWHLPEDLKHFKRETLNKTMVMGRRTFDEIGKPLPRRHNVVITRGGRKFPKGITPVKSLAEALAIAESPEVMIAGGGEIYRLALPRADRLLLSHVDTVVADADTFFPRFSKKRWAGWLMDRQGQDPRHEHAVEFWEYLPAIKDDKVLCRTPAEGRRPTRIPSWKFDAMTDAILGAVDAAPDGRIAFRDLAAAVGKQLPAEQRSKLGSIGWHVTCVKLELEVRGTLTRGKAGGRQVLYRT
ncbi:MAG: dihydrofolate reductase [Pseudomonadota bacterium]